MKLETNSSSKAMMKYLESSLFKKKGYKTTKKKLKAHNYYNLKLINWPSRHCLFLPGNSLKTLKGFINILRKTQINTTNRQNLSYLTYSNFRHFDYEKRAFSLFWLISRFVTRFPWKALSWNHDDCYKECMWLKPVLFSF